MVESLAAFGRRGIPPGGVAVIIHGTIRLEDDRLRTLVMNGVRPDGVRRISSLEDGYRESAVSWAAVLRDPQRREMRD